jgi:hypothetical protein
LFRKMTASVSSALVRAQTPVTPLTGLLRQVCRNTEQHGVHFQYLGRDGQETILFRLGMDLAGQRVVQVPDLGEALRLQVDNVIANNMYTATSHLGCELLEVMGGDPDQAKLALIWYQPLAGATGRLTIALRNIDPSGAVIG